MKSLIIIDCQTEWKYEVEDIKEDVILLIKEFKKKKLPIILVEFKGCGGTVKPIKDLLKNYSKTIIVKKNDDDGGVEIGLSILKNNLSTHTFFVCGLYGDACVEASINTLNRHVPKSTKIILVKKAIVNSWKFGRYHKKIKVYKAPVKKLLQRI